MMTAAASVSFALVFSYTTVNQIEDSLQVRDISSLVPVSDVPPADPDDPLAGKDVNILIMGSDVRDGDNSKIGGYVAGMRADATVIMHISADRTRMELVSIPRDLRVRVSDCELFDGTTVRGWTGKFNIAFANGGKQGDPAEGAACAMRTVTDLTGVQFDGHYVVMDFSGFEDMIDALNGVPMCVPQPVSSKKAKLNLEAGPQVLDGKTALAYARARTGVGLGDGSDLNRIERQQELMGNTMRKALGVNMLTDTGTLTKFVRAVAESLTLDPRLGDVGYLSGLAFSLRNIDTDNIVFETVPWGSPGDGSGDIVMTAEAQPLFDKLVNDEPIREPEVEDIILDPPAPGSATTPAPKPATQLDTEKSESQAAPSAAPAPESEPEPERESQEDILDACA
jgi:LCP family protein required for cell wall assembly